MKKNVIFLLLLPVLFFVACKEQTADYSVIYRDQYSTGGDISFSYDNITHTAYFGGENEVIPYYSNDITKGWESEGNRVGVKLVSPVKVTNSLSGYANLNGIEFENGCFYKNINNETSNIAEFYPLVSEENSEIELRIVWQDGVKEQIYKIVIKDGTIFMKNGS